MAVTTFGRNRFGIQKIKKRNFIKLNNFIE